MIFEQHYLECLSQASYFIGDETTGRAVVVDPRRDVSPYLETAEANDMAIELVLETHFHADFLSGHLELAALTGADICYGSEATTEFTSRPLRHGERLSLGEVELEIRHTPGHTPESISIVVYERGSDEVPYGVLTGDTLFIGDVGRPDLLSSVGVGADELAGSLYDSLHGQLMTLPDATRVYPGHGAGSSCGKNLSSDTWSTIGVQRESNYAVADMTKAEFIDVVTAGQSSPPKYFAYDAGLNRAERPLLEEAAMPMSLTVEDLASQATGTVVLDTRSPDAFAESHLEGALNIGLGGRFAEFAGGLISPEEQIVLVTDEGAERESKNRLARIGFDNVVGAIASSGDTLLAAPQGCSAQRVTVEEMASMTASQPELQVLDIRGPGETADGTIPGAHVIPLPKLAAECEVLDKDKPVLVYCAGGYRSSIGASLLRRHGFAEVTDLIGGYGAWSANAHH